jgi:hypothetical protein
VFYGGTGRNILTTGNVLIGNGTSPINFVAPAANGHVLTVVSSNWASRAPVIGSYTEIAGVAATQSVTNSDSGGLITVATGSATSTLAITSANFLVGNMFAIYNAKSTPVSVSVDATGTLQLAGSTTPAGTRSLAQNAFAIVVCVASSISPAAYTFIIYGEGVT